MGIFFSRETGLGVLVPLKNNSVGFCATHSSIPALAKPWLGQDLENKECPWSFPGLLLGTNDRIAFPSSSAPSGHWPGHGQLTVQIACACLQPELLGRGMALPQLTAHEGLTQCAAVA